MTDVPPPDPTPDGTTTKRGLPVEPAVIILVAAIVAFAIANSDTTKIQWIVGSSRAPLFVVIAICVIVGFAAGYLVARRQARRA